MKETLIHNLEIEPDEMLELLIGEENIELVIEENEEIHISAENPIKTEVIETLAMDNYSHHSTEEGAMVAIEKCAAIISGNGPVHSLFGSEWVSVGGWGNQIYYHPVHDVGVAVGHNGNMPSFVDGVQLRRGARIGQRARDAYIEAGGEDNRDIFGKQVDEEAA